MRHCAYHRSLVLLTALFAWSASAEALAATPLVQKARDQIGVTTGYDPSYRKLAYPGGDVPQETGVCSDVVVRAFRGLNVDLQKEVHEDMKVAFSEYPRNWGLSRPDRNIDHRRVPNLMTYFKRRGWSFLVKREAALFRPGDVIAWKLNGGQHHIGIVSDRRSARGTPLIIHNIGNGVQEEDILLSYTILGQYRPKFTSIASDDGEQR